MSPSAATVDQIFIDKFPRLLDMKELNEFRNGMRFQIFKKNRNKAEIYRIAVKQTIKIKDKGHKEMPQQHGLNLNQFEQKYPPLKQRLPEEEARPRFANNSYITIF